MLDAVLHAVPLQSLPFVMSLQEQLIGFAATRFRLAAVESKAGSDARLFFESVWKQPPLSRP